VFPDIAIGSIRSNSFLLRNTWDSHLNLRILFWFQDERTYLTTKISIKSLEKFHELPIAQNKELRVWMWWSKMDGKTKQNSNKKILVIIIRKPILWSLKRTKERIKIKRKIA